jgi:hypothetical protein
LLLLLLLELLLLRRPSLATASLAPQTALADRGRPACPRGSPVRPFARSTGVPTGRPAGSRLSGCLARVPACGKDVEVVSKFFDPAKNHVVALLSNGMQVPALTYAAGPGGAPAGEMGFRRARAWSAGASWACVSGALS